MVLLMKGERLDHNKITFLIKDDLDYMELQFLFGIFPLVLVLKF